MDYLQGQVFEQYSSHNLDRLTGSKPEKESSKAVVKLIEQKLRIGSRILEVGCSSGHLLRTLNNKNLALKYVGVDIDRYAIKKGNESIANLELLGIENAQLMESSVEDLPFDDDEFHLDLPEPKDELDELGNPKVYIYQNVYSKELISGILHEQTDLKSWKIFEDDMFDQQAFDLDNKVSNLPRITKVINGKQVRGLFIDTNYWMTVEK